MTIPREEYGATHLITPGGVVVAQRAGTLTQLQALGTSMGISATAGSRTIGWDTTNNRFLYCLTATATTSTWGYKATELFRFVTTSSAAALRYWVVTGSGVVSSIDGTARIQARWPGEVKRIEFRAANDIASCLLGVHLDLNTTPVETQSVDPGAGTLVGANFAASTFTASQILTFAITPSADPGISNCTVEVVYEVTAA